MPDFLHLVIAAPADSLLYAGRYNAVLVCLSIVVAIFASYAALLVTQHVATPMALTARGVGFSLDDFGTGYSSLSYLKRLPICQLKIDRTFVRDILENPSDAAITKVILTLAQNMGLTAIAEGVETREQHRYLAGLGCDVYQGYLFGRPVPPAEFLHLLARTTASPVLMDA